MALRLRVKRLVRVLELVWMRVRVLMLMRVWVLVRVSVRMRMRMRVGVELLGLGLGMGLGLGLRLGLRLELGLGLGLRLGLGLNLRLGLGLDLLRLRRLLLDQVLLLLPRRLDRQYGLTIFVLHHLQRDLGVPALVLGAPKVDLFALRHHHGEVHILALALHAVYSLHVGKVQFLQLDWWLKAGDGGATRLGRFGCPLPGLLLLLLLLMLGRYEQ